MVSLELKKSNGFKVYPDEIQFLFVSVMEEMTGKSKSKLYVEAMSAMIEHNKGVIQSFISKKKENPEDV